jgi:hypothetical protein
MEIRFASIDAKDDIYTGYDTLGAIDENRNKVRYSAQDYDTINQAEVEYLTKLLALQKEIADKYEPLLVGGEEVTEEEAQVIYNTKYKDFFTGVWFIGLFYT